MYMYFEMPEENVAFNNDVQGQHKTRCIVCRPSRQSSAQPERPRRRETLSAYSCDERMPEDTGEEHHQREYGEYNILCNGIGLRYIETPQMTPRCGSVRCTKTATHSISSSNTKHLASTMNFTRFVTNQDEVSNYYIADSITLCSYVQKTSAVLK